MQTARKIFAVLTVVIGFVVIFLGASLLKTSVDSSADTGSVGFTAGSHPVDYASFGADFYTYMYEASYNMVRGLNDIQEGLESAVSVQNNVRKEVAANTNAVDTLTETVARVGGYIVIAIGLGILVHGGQCVLAAFSKPRPAAEPAE